MDDQILVAILREVRENRRKLNVLLNEEYYMADALQAAFDGLSAEVNDTEQLEGSVAAELQALADQVKNIQPGTTVTPEQVESLATGLTSATQALKGAADSAQPAPAPEQPATPEATVTPVPTVDPAAVADQPAQAQPTADVVSGTPDQTATTAAPAADQPTADTAESVQADAGEAAAVAVAAAGGTPIDPASAEQVPADQVEAAVTPEQADEAAAQPAQPAVPSDGAPAGTTAPGPDVTSA